MTLKTLPRYKSNQGIAYTKTGKGPSLVFIHGVGLRAESWGPQIDYFKSRFTVYAIDLPGHGDSNLIKKDSPDINSYSEVIAAFIENETTLPVVIIGHSLGALIALNIADKHPGLCKGIAAISTIFNRTSDAFVAVKSRAKFIRDNPEQNLSISPLQRWFKDQSSWQAQLCKNMIESNSPKGYADAYGAFANSQGCSEAGVNQSKLPLLFVTGEKDYNSTPAMSEALANIGQNATAVIIKEARHMVQLSHTKETNTALEAFFEKAQNKHKV